MRRVIAILLVLVVTGNVSANGGSSAGDAIRDQVSRIPAGAFVEIRLTDKTKIRGNISTADADGFILRTGDVAGTPRNIRFADVKSVKVVTRTHTPAAAWIATGVIAAIVVIAVAVFAIERHNE